MHAYNIIVQLYTRDRRSEWQSHVPQKHEYMLFRRIGETTFISCLHIVLMHAYFSSPSNKTHLHRQFMTYLLEW